MFSTSLTILGLESTSQGIQGALVCLKKGKFCIEKIFSFPKDNAQKIQKEVGGQAVFCTGLKGSEVLLRSLNLPLVKEKDIEEALSFQAEPLLPYSVDEALLARQTIKKEADSTDILLLSARKNSLEEHLQEWRSFEIEPEKISTLPSALFAFGSTFFPDAKDYLILHQGEEESHALLIQEGHMAASFSQKDKKAAECSSQAKKVFYRMAYSIAKSSNRTLEGFVLCGKWADNEKLVEELALELRFPCLTIKETEDHFSSKEKLLHAYPIGLAAAALGKQPVIDFRQGDYAYPHPWKRLKAPLALYFLLIALLAAAFYLFGQTYLEYKQNEMRQAYIDLLAGMNKTHSQLEAAYLAKNPSAFEKFGNEEPDIYSLDHDDFMERLAFLQKEVQSTPDSFPLFANIPRVSDVLAWLSHHPAVVADGGKIDGQSKLQIENFSYAVLKRPMQGKKQDKYQVKVELEFSSPTPKWAREFHDALIASNDWVDPKGEVKWSSNRGRYKTSFFLKDKTHYPSQ